MPTAHVYARRSFGRSWMPGLVMAWRRTDAGWEAQVVVVDGERTWIEWFVEDELRPVESVAPGD